MSEMKGNFTVHDFLEYTYLENLKDRKIILNEDVTDSLVETLIMQIIKFNDEDKYTPVDQRKPIRIFLNTNGGDVHIGLVACNVIKQSETPVEVTVLGNALSMGSLLLISGHKRYAYDYSNILIHDGSTVVIGTTNKVKDHMKYQDVKDKQIKDFIIKNTKITEEKYQEMEEREWWITASEALDLGIIDAII